MTSEDALWAKIKYQKDQTVKLGSWIQKPAHSQKTSDHILNQASWSVGHKPSWTYKIKHGKPHNWSTGLVGRTCDVWLDNVVKSIVTLFVIYVNESLQIILHHFQTPEINK